MRGHRVLPQDPAEAGADLARPDPHVAQLADRRIAVDAVAAGHQAAQVGDHEVSSRDVVGTEGELLPARLDEWPGRSPRIPCGECQVAQHARLIRPGTPQCDCGHFQSPSVVECQAGPTTPLPPNSALLCTVLTMPLDDLPDWLPAWCVDQLGDEPVSVLFELRQISAVFGLRL